MSLAIALASFPAFAGEKEVRMQVLGAVCPSCAYGLEKQFMRMDGVKAFDVDFKAGIVSVCVRDDVQFKDEELSKIFKETGYSYKGKEERAACQKS
jgi:copper chaperone CopZ